MSSEESETEVKTEKPSWMRRPMQILLGFVVFWLVGVNLFLNTPLAPWAINRTPEKWSITWDRAWSPYPAKVFVSGFAYEQKIEKMGVLITADKVSAKVRIAPFLSKTFRADDIRVSGLAAVLDRSQGSGIAPPKNDPRPPGMTIQLLGIDVENLKEFRFDAFSVVGGDGTVSGDFEMQIRGDMVIRDADLAWREAVGRLREDGGGESVDIEFRGGFSPFNPKKEKGLKMLAHLSGTIEVEGQVGSLAPLKAFFASAKWIESIDGQGEVAISLEMLNGRLQPGSKVDIDADDLLVDFMGFRATGSGRVDGRVEEGDEGRDARITVLFDEFSYGRQAQEEPMAFGSGLRLETTIDDLEREDLAEGVKVTLDLPTSEVPDVSFLGRTMPESMGLTLTGGEASLQAHLEARGGKEQAKGTFDLQGHDLTGTFKDFEFEIDLDVTTRLSGRDWDDFEVRLKGTEVRLFDGVFKHPDVGMTDGWWMSLKIPAGRANLAMPLDVDAEIDLSMRDTRVLVALFAELKSWVQHFDGLLTVHNVVGHTQASLSDQHLSLRDLKLEANKLEGRGELELAKGEASAVFWVKIGFFSLALERIGTEIDWKMINSRNWYDEQVAESWESKHGEPLVPEPTEEEDEE